VTLVRRLARGENVVKAHRTHLYQRMVSTELSHRRVSLTYLALAALGLPAGISMAAGSWPLTGLRVLVVAGAAVALRLTVARREAATARPVS
jgi:hypothetical protein